MSQHPAWEDNADWRQSQEARFAGLGLRTTESGGPPALKAVGCGWVDIDWMWYHDDDRFHLRADSAAVSPSVYNMTSPKLLALPG